MFRSLQNTVSQIRNINGDYTKMGPKPPFLYFLQNPSLHIRNRLISSSPSSSFVVSYLVNTCGLSEDKAISASKIINFETSSRPDSVLTILETNGFTKPHISKLITSCPSLLLRDPDKTLKPKLEFFNSIGLSGLDLAKFLSTASTVLNRSLQNQIIPIFAFLKSILHSDKNVITALKSSSRLLKEKPGRRLVPNIELLRDQGVPESKITRLLLIQPGSFLVKTDQFKKIVEEINGMGFDPKKYTFLLAIVALTGMSKSTLEAKFDVYRRWGWSENEIRSAFRKQPWCMMTSEKKIMAIMNFLVNEMGFSASLIAEHSQVIMFSLEKRIIPRCLVLRVLVSKNLVKKEFHIATVLAMVEESFLKKYVIKYEQEVPELLKAYQGQLDCLELLVSSEGVDGLKML